MNGDKPTVELVEITKDEGIKIAGAYLKLALDDLADGDTEHAMVWIDSALVWMGERDGE